MLSISELKKDFLLANLGKFDIKGVSVYVKPNDSEDLKIDQMFKDGYYFYGYILPDNYVYIYHNTVLVGSINKAESWSLRGVRYFNKTQVYTGASYVGLLVRKQ